MLNYILASKRAMCSVSVKWLKCEIISACLCVVCIKASTVVTFLWFKDSNRLKGMRNNLKLSVQIGIFEPAIGFEKGLCVWYMGGKQVSSWAWKHDSMF